MRIQLLNVLSICSRKSRKKAFSCIYKLLINV